MYMDDFKRAQFSGKGNYCSCCDIHPDKCKNSQEMRGRVRERLKRDLRELWCAAKRDTEYDCE